jgi:hypothetical protein
MQLLAEAPTLEAGAGGLGFFASEQASAGVISALAFLDVRVILPHLQHGKY